jgi:hypothetical protein
VLGHSLTPGDKAWFIMSGGIVSYDVWAIATGRQTMTEACRTALHHPKHKWYVIAAWGLTTKHLFLGDLAKWSDPFNVIAGLAFGLKKIIKESEKCLPQRCLL